MCDRSKRNRNLRSREMPVDGTRTNCIRPIDVRPNNAWTNSVTANALSNESVVRNAALRYLARREYAVQELRYKLGRKYLSDVVAVVLDELVAEELLSDRRFTSMLVRSRISRGYGPRYIAAELSQKGIAQELIEEHLDVTFDVWLDNARQLATKRLAGARNSDAAKADRDRVARLLSRRGFPTDIIFKALAQLTIE